MYWLIIESINLFFSFLTGGMVTQGGIGLRDFNTPLFGSNGSSAMEWIKLNSKHYNVTTPVYQPDNYVGVHNLWILLKQRPAISVFLNQSLVESLVKTGRRIKSFATYETYSPASGVRVMWQGKTFIDATYEGDLMRASGAHWTFGREARDKYNESLAGVTNKSVANFGVNVLATWPNGSLLKWVDDEVELKPTGQKDDRVMGYSYRLCITNRKSNQAPFPSPEKGNLQYNPDDFELMRRYYNAMKEAGHNVTVLPFDEGKYRGYPPGDKIDVCDSGTQTPITTDAANLAAGK